MRCRGRRGDCSALCAWKEGEPFQYWIGMVPGRRVRRRRMATVLWISLRLTWGSAGSTAGRMRFMARNTLCAAPLQEMGMEIVADEQGAWWFFERYACPRFTTPD